MAQAYTPGLKCVAKADIIKDRKLPLFGEVLVKDGDVVKAKDLVAKTELPGKIYPMNVRGELGLNKPEELIEAMLKKEGDYVKKGEVVARTKGFLGFFKSEYKSPIEGTISQISHFSGQVVFNEPPIPVEIDAYFDGKVVETFDKEGVKNQSVGAHIQGILGLGGETYGEVIMAVKTPSELLEETHITDEMKGKIVVGGSRITSGALNKAKEVGVAGVVVGGFDYEDIRSILGQDLGVAITGHEKIGLTLVLTEGFGEIPMAKRTFDLLKRFEGFKAAINGATQIRAGVMRPEIIIIHDEAVSGSTKDYTTDGIVPGDQVRVIRYPYFGKIGTIIDLPVELKQMESGTWVRTILAEIDGEEVYVPRQNIEVIEK